MKSREVKRLLRQSHCPEHRRLLALTQGRHGDIEHLTELADNRLRPAAMPGLDVIDLVINPRVIC